MTPADYERVRAVFLAARDRPAAERGELIDTLCAGEARLRAEVEALLAADAAGDSFLESPALGTAFAMCGSSAAGGVALPEPSAGPLPEKIGRYRVLDLLGEGGMGVVYRAAQEHPQRIVALKVIKPGFDSPEIRRRFEHEAELLGWLQHPGIAQIFEAGTAEVGAARRPFFAMELVAGQPLTDYAAARGLGIPERLALLARVCDAVQHAHQKGVIHRDLKPGNILVTADGQPKILDFGVARATGADLSGSTLQTLAGQIIGTVAYMSPEQLAGDPGQLDTRSDVYALGAVLYELLTGRTPLDVAGRTLPQAVRTITEQEPRPCGTVNRLLRGEIETIVHKALAKDRNRRYASASDLAADIRRFLADQPISARPATALYHLHKFARRNKALVAGVAVALAALVLALGQTIAERNRAVQAERVARLQRAEAEHQAAVATAVNEFLNSDLLAAANPAAQGREVTVREALDRAAEAIGTRFADEPLVEAAIRLTVGDTYASLGEYDAATAELERALALYREAGGPRDAGTLRAMDRLGVTCTNAARYPEAEALLRECVQARRDALGPDDLVALETLNHLALLYGRMGRRAEEERLYREVLERGARAYGEEHGIVCNALGNLSDALCDQGRYAEAEPLARRALEIQTRRLGEEHPGTLSGMNGLAKLLTRMERLDEAEPLAVRALEIRRRVLGNDHPRTLMSMNTLALVYKRQRRFDLAEPLCRETLEAKRRILGPEHPDTLVSLNNLASLLATARRTDEAEPLYLQLIDIRSRVLGDEHPHTRSARASLAELYRNTGRPELAEGLRGPAGSESSE